MLDEKAISQRASIDVKFFCESIKKLFKVEVLTGEIGFDKFIYNQNIHRPGLALAGFVDVFSYDRVQIFGNTEMRFLSLLNNDERTAALEKYFTFQIPCIIITNGIAPFDEMLEIATREGIALLSSKYETTKLSYFISDFLDDQFAPRASIHGSFIDVYGIGMLFVGKSGVGKSEVALDLIERGHRLVGDDVIILTKKGEGIIMGSGTDISKHFMEIRGLGLINVERMFGIRSVRYQKRLEVIVELEIWDSNSEYDRTGLEEKYKQIMDVGILNVKLPIVPGKNLTVIAEVIALQYLLKHYGYDSAQVFQNRLNAALKSGIDGTRRGVDYFEHDFE